MTINFNEDLFNPLYWHLRRYMADENIRYIYIYGGSSAAKTYTVVQSVVVDTFQERDNYMILRKYGSDIEDSIYSDFKGVISGWGLAKYFEQIKNKIRNVSGGYIRFRGLDDSEKIKGIARFKRVILEEMSQFEHEDLKQIRKRLRGRPGQQIIGMWNPISEEHWIKTEIIDKQEWTEQPREITGRANSKLDDDSFILMNKTGNAIVIKTTYKDNFWIVGHPTKATVGFRDEHVLQDFEDDRIHDYPYYYVYALGNWGKLDSGAEFYKSFNPATSVVKTPKYDPDKPIHASFDENVNPYLAVSIWQADGNHLWQIDEIALGAPRNTLQNVLTEFEKRYHNHRGGLYVYGDATSRKADAKLEKGYNFFTIITKGLDRFQPKVRVPLSNPPVMIRGMFINQLLSGRFTGYRIEIGDNCKKTIEDLRYVKEAADGTKLKEKTKDPKTGVTYEPYGHLSDTLDYFVCFYLSGKFNEFQHGDSTNKRVALRANDATIF